jgi:hypothetical protein
VLLEAELAFEGVDDALDPLADAAQRAMPAWLIATVGPHQARAQLGHRGLEGPAGEALSPTTTVLVSSAGGVSASSSAEQLSGDLTLAELRAGQAPVDRCATGAPSVAVSR